MSIMSWISKKTAWIRYGFVWVMLKCVTPSLYRKVVDMFTSDIGRVPRPSTLYMKKYFGDIPLVGAEIGVNTGENSINLLEMLNMKVLYLVDVYNLDCWRDTAFGEAYERVKPYRRSTQFKIGLSVDMAKVLKGQGVELDFVYIDANHDYDFVYDDLNAWVLLVKKGGIVCGHDILNHKGVINAVKDWCFENEVRFFIEAPDWYFIKDW